MRSKLEIFLTTHRMVVILTFNKVIKDYRVFVISVLIAYLTKRTAICVTVVSCHLTFPVDYKIRLIILPSVLKKVNEDAKRSVGKVC